MFNHFRGYCRLLNLILWSWGLMLVHLVGQTHSLRFQHLTIEDGLAQNMIDCIHQDKTGFLWIGTWNGLCRYDGYEVKVYDNQSCGINNFIYVIEEDAEGNLWIGTKEGLYIYKQNEDVFEKIFLEGSVAGSIVTINALLRKDEKTMLAGTNQGLFEISMGRKHTYAIQKPEVWMQNERDLKNVNIQALLLDDLGRTWIGTNKGLVVLDKQGKSVMRLVTENKPESLSSNQVLALHQMKNGSIWVGTEFGLNQFLGPDRFQRFFVNAENPTDGGIPHNTIMDLDEDGEGKLLIATLGGLGIFHPQSGKFENYLEENYLDHGLNNNFVNCIHKDTYGNIWLGTERGGVNMFNRHYAVFEHYEHKGNRSGLSHPIVNSVFEDERYVWVGTAGGGLNRYTKSSGNWDVFRAEPSQSGTLLSDFITLISKDRQGDLWVGTWGGGVQRAYEKGKSGLRFEPLVYPPGLSEKFSFVSSVAEDEVGNLWIGTLGGLLFYDHEKRTVLADFLPSQSSITEVGCIWTGKDELWLGTRWGLYQISNPYHATKRKVKLHQSNAEQAGSISGNYVISVCQDKKGHMWFGTYGNGINRFDRKSQSFQTFSTREGLINNIVYTIQEGIDGNIWMSTDLGLSALNPETSTIRNYTESDGLLNDQYYWSASHQNKQGKLYFGGMNGMDAFNPQDLKDQTVGARVVLTDIQLMNRTVKPGSKYNQVDVLIDAIPNAKQINLSYKEKVVSFEFASLVFRDARTLKYAFILENLEKDWNVVSADRRYVSYTNLEPGDYTFKVKVSNADGVFTDHALELKIHINSPFWQTVWFQFLVALFIIGTVVGYYRYRTYSLRRQKLILEKRVDERTEQIHLQNEKLENQNWEIQARRDELIDLNQKLKMLSESRMNFFTNVSHEFRTPLTLIIEPLENLLKHNFESDPELHHEIKTAHHGAKRLMGLVDQILDVRKLEKLKLVLLVSPIDFRSYFEEIYEAFSSLAKLRNLSFTYEVNGLDQLVYLDSEKISYILYNLLSNAFKYTEIGGSIHVEISDSVEKNGHKWMQIKVSDDGIGIAEENLKLIFERFYRVNSNENFDVVGSGIGLSMTRDLVVSHHGSIEVASKEGEGSVFMVKIPVSKNSYESDEIMEAGQKLPELSRQVDILKEELTAGLVDVDSRADEYFPYNGHLHTVLVVEDNLDLRKLVVQRLSTEFKVIEAIDGRAGIELAQKHNPDLIVSDVMMPQVDGLELCAYIKNHLETCHIPIILLTAKSAVEDQIQGFDLGADDYLPKPFHSQLLISRIHNLIASRERLRSIYRNSDVLVAEEVTSNQKDKDFLEKAISVVRENLEDGEFNVADLMKQMNVSRSLLHKKLANLTGQSTTEFINHIRLQRAIEMFRSGESHISEVAYTVGFKDPKYFTRVFSKHFGSSPKAYIASLAGK